VQFAEQTAAQAESADAAVDTTGASAITIKVLRRNGQEAARRLRVVAARMQADGITRFGARVE
jgi:hypothetical protein